MKLKFNINAIRFTISTEQPYIVHIAKPRALKHPNGSINIIKTKATSINTYKKEVGMKLL